MKTNFRDDHGPEAHNSEEDPNPQSMVLPLFCTVLPGQGESQCLKNSITCLMTSIHDLNHKIKDQLVIGNSKTIFLTLLKTHLKVWLSCYGVCCLFALVCVLCMCMNGVYKHV